MRVGLMVPCYIDMFYPRVGVATLELLEKLGVEVDYPFDQTCCGQPMANSGAYQEAKATEELFIRNFARYDHIVAPSGSCVHHLRHKFCAADDTPERRHVSAHVWDLPEFLHDVLQVEEFPWAEFPHQVALHLSCSSRRGLGGQAMNGRPDDPRFSKPKNLLEKVKGISFADFCDGGARHVVSADMSCLMHLEACAHRDREDFRFLHLAQVLNGDAA